MMNKYYILMKIFSFMLIFSFTLVMFFSINQIWDFELASISGFTLNFIVMLDMYSMLFMSTVMLIASSVYTFSCSYMFFEYEFKRFHYLMFTFVMSMMLLILSPNMFSILLGWDGLGISSYLLVIYYSSKKSFNSGMITALSNRIGDAFIIVSLGTLFSESSNNFMMMQFFINLESLPIIFLFMIAGCTKSAQIPFSAWLPAAMAAPTPVSSLVHSSTLVTAGIYLLIRFDMLLVLLNLNFFLLILGVMTMTMASISAFFEMDMKKMVALSTLSQLGVMMCSLGAGMPVLAYFHLLSHAFFKALLFISAGNLIHASGSYQDLRVMGGSMEIYPYSLSMILSASGSLCGLPFMSAFYSKEAIIEILLMFNFSIYIHMMMFIGIALTFIYSIRFIFLSLWCSTRQCSCLGKADSDTIINISMLMLIIPAISAGNLLEFIMLNSSSFVIVDIYLKLMVLILMMMSMIILSMVSKMNPLIFSHILIWNLGNLWSLSFMSTRIPIIMLNNMGDYYYKSSDFSWVYMTFTKFIPTFYLANSHGFIFNNIGILKMLKMMMLLIILSMMSLLIIY